MAKTLKMLLAAVVLMGVLLAAAVAYLFFALDPNDYKPELQALAKAQGYELRLNGEIDWQFFPSLALTVNDIEIADSESEVADELLAKVVEAQASVQLVPLLSGQVIVESIVLDGGQWFIAENQTTENPSSSNDSIDTASTDNGPKSSAFELRADLIEVRDFTLALPLSSGRLSIAVERATVRNFNLKAAPFQVDSSVAIQFSGSQELPEQPELSEQPELRVTQQLELLISPDLTQLTLSSSETRVSLANGAAATLLANGLVDVSSSDVQLKANLTTGSLAQWLSAMEISAGGQGGLRQLTSAFTVSAGSEQWQLTLDELRLDQTRAQGSVTNRDGQWAVQLDLDQLDTGLYIASNSEEGGSEASDNGAAELSDEPLPLEFLEALNADVAVTLGQLIHEQIQVDTIAINASARPGQVTLRSLSANLYEGSLAVNGELRAGSGDSTVTVSATLAQVALTPLLSAFADEQRLSGTAAINVNASTQGQSLRDWQEALSATYDLSASALQVSEFDIERNICELTALINREPLPQYDWKNYSALQDVKVTGQLNGRQWSLSQIQAGVEELSLRAKGGGDYRSGDFDLRGDVVVPSSDDQRLCRVNRRWRDRPLPLRCKGNIDAVSTSTCGPDRKRLDDVVRDELKSRATEELSDKLKDSLGEERGEAVENLLRGLFNR